MLVNQITIGRFHHFHLARQLEKKGLLANIWSGYPSFKLKDEQGIPKSKIQTFPWVHAPYMVRGRLGLSNWDVLNKAWEWLDRETLDKYVAHNLKKRSILLALSSCGLHSGIKNQSLGGKYICDRASSHIGYQNQILIEEYQRWGLEFEGIDSRVIEKEEKEYDQANFITVPSEFVKKSFIKMGILEDKLIKIPYGARLDRFVKNAEPSKDVFRLLWVGSVSIRKAFIDALVAFQAFKHPKKEFVVIGPVESAIKKIIQKYNLENVFFKGRVPNQELSYWYSSSHVFVLPSVEEGLAYVQGEALACGCPVIATKNTGSEDLFTNGKEGFIVPIRSSEAIIEKLNLFADDELLRQEMSFNAIQKIKSLGGWDKYGDQMAEVLQKF